MLAFDINVQGSIFASNLPRSFGQSPNLLRLSHLRPQNLRANNDPHQKRGRSI
jgi:hypothetical protein